ncbi:MAG: hypothetical protein H0S80_14690 [Desulfovibrionaceae bacterium]|nr:hypothetical protein [Desulfovibrionaceae bacterium]
MARSRTVLPARLVAAFLLLAALGCTPKTPPGTLFDAPGAAWQSFRAHYCAPPKAPAVRIKASLHYTRITPRKRTNRTLATLWGDFGGPMRMDVSASIGKLLAHIRENGDGLLVFYPSDNEAYAHASPVLGATRLGMPFPFSLKVLAAVLNGDFSDLSPRRFETAEQIGGMEPGFAYGLKDGLVTRIVLDAAGRPVRIEGATSETYAKARAWRLTIDRYAEAQPGAAPLPDKVTLALDDGEKGVLHIKSREFMLAPWPAKALDLALPDGVVPVRLDNDFNHEQDGDIPVVYEDK